MEREEIHSEETKKNQREKAVGNQLGLGQSTDGTATERAVS